MTTMRDQLQAARYKLTQPEVAPYYARVAYALRFVEITEDGILPCDKDGIPTVGVDSKLRLYYSEKTAGKWTTEELVAVMAHEVNHVLRDHSKRAPQLAKTDGKVQWQWNIAGDCEINDDLKASGLKMPERVVDQATGKPSGYVLPEDIGAPDGLTAEEYFRYKREQDEQEGEQDGDQQGNGPMDGKCGTSAGGDDGDSPADGQGEDGVTAGEAEIIRQQSAKDIQEHAKSRGTVPAGLKRWADEILDSSVPWQQELAAVVRNAYAQAKGKRDYTYRRPSFRRTSGSNGFVMPNLYEPIPHIGFIVDTSGSMGGRELAEGIAEINGVLKAQGANANVTVIATDAKVHEVKKVYSARQIESLQGGGGTDMRVGIQQALDKRAEVIIVFTDGYTPWPSEQPRVPVIVCLTTEGQTVPAWARVVRVTHE